MKPSTGETHGDTVVIGAGLKPGEHVVMEDQQRLREGARVAEKVDGVGKAGAKQGAGA